MSFTLLTLYFKALFMSKINPIQDLQEIRKMMEENSKFLSLSGLTGVFAGSMALIGVFSAHLLIQEYSVKFLHYSAIGRLSKASYQLELNLFLIAVGVLVFAIGGGLIMTALKAKKNNQKLFSPITYRLLRSLMIPLFFAAIFIVGLYYHKAYLLIPPAMLIFYGMALLNASKYVHVDIKYLAVSEMILGSILIFVPQYGLWFWAIGFGVLHILYGAIMHFKYDRKNSEVE
jgi:hypothetical protein